MVEGPEELRESLTSGEQFDCHEGALDMTYTWAILGFLGASEPLLIHSKLMQYAMNSTLNYWRYARECGSTT